MEPALRSQGIGRPPPLFSPSVAVVSVGTVENQVWTRQVSEAEQTNTLDLGPGQRLCGPLGAASSILPAPSQPILHGNSPWVADILLTAEPRERQISLAVPFLTDAITVVKFGPGGCDEVLF